MKLESHRLKPISVFMAVLIVLTSLPYQAVSAAMVSTEVSRDVRSAPEARGLILSLIAREEVQTQLKLYGVDPNEARARVDSMSDAEVIEVANRFDRLPAGGSAVGIIVGAILLVFLVLLLTDLLGFTNVFPFVKKHI